MRADGGAEHSRLVSLTLWRKDMLPNDIRNLILDYKYSMEVYERKQLVLVELRRDFLWTQYFNAVRFHLFIDYLDY